MFKSIILALLMQVGMDPTAGAMPGLPDELANRPPREQAEKEVPRPQGSELSQCLLLAGQDPQAALDRAQMWREGAFDDAGLAQSAHCLGLALVQLGRFEEAQRIFVVAGNEAPADNPAYRARLNAMAGNAAMARGEPAAALELFSLAFGQAQSAADGSLAAGLQTDRARALVALDRSEEAVEALAQARTFDAADPQAWLLSATLSRRLGRLGEAQQQIEYAAALDQQNPAIGLEAGVIAALSGRAEDARRSFESVLIVAPDSDEANRARAYLEQLAQ